MTLPSKFTPLVLPILLSLVCCLTNGCTRAAVEAESPAAGASEQRSSHEQRFSFSSGGGTFDAAIDRPARGAANGWGVVLIGGGMGNDLDWSVPGSIVVNGTATALTISGERHDDAPVISRALAAAGFTVLRWSTIAENDPLRDRWPVEATSRTLGELLQQSRDAVGTLRREGGVREDRLIIVGHSLGAARACTLAAEDEGVRGLMLLSPAYFTHASKPPALFGESGMRVGAEVVRERGIACLAIFGGMDTSKAVDEAGVRALVGAPGFEKLETRTFEGLGHALGEQKGSLVGPISTVVVEAMVEWARRKIAPRYER